MDSSRLIHLEQWLRGKAMVMMVVMGGGGVEGWWGVVMIGGGGGECFCCWVFCGGHGVYVVVVCVVLSILFLTLPSPIPLFRFPTSPSCVSTLYLLLLSFPFNNSSCLSPFLHTCFPHSASFLPFSNRPHTFLLQYIFHFKFSSYIPLFHCPVFPCLLLFLLRSHLKSIPIYHLFLLHSFNSFSYSPFLPLSSTSSSAS